MMIKKINIALCIILMITPTWQIPFGDDDTRASSQGATTDDSNSNASTPQQPLTPNPKNEDETKEQDHIKTATEIEIESYQKTIKELTGTIHNNILLCDYDTNAINQMLAKSNEFLRKLPEIRISKETMLNLWRYTQKSNHGKL